jgi:hypothetical protein
MAEITLEKKTKIHGDLGNHLGKIIGLANARLSSAAAAGWSIGKLCPYKLPITIFRFLVGISYGSRMTTLAFNMRAGLDSRVSCSVL